MAAWSRVRRSFELARRLGRGGRRRDHAARLPARPPARRRRDVGYGGGGDDGSGVGSSRPGRRGRWGDRDETRPAAGRSVGYTSPPRRFRLKGSSPTRCQFLHATVPCSHLVLSAPLPSARSQCPPRTLPSVSPSRDSARARRATVSAADQSGSLAWTVARRGWRRWRARERRRGGCGCEGGLRRRRSRVMWRDGGGWRMQKR